MVFIFYFIVIVMIGVLVQRLYPHQIQRQNGIVLFWGMFLLLLIAGLRSTDVGGDLVGYVKHFYDYGNMSFETFTMRSATGMKDPIFYAFSWVVYRVFGNEHWWFFLIALAYISAVYCFAKRYSPYPIISILAFIALGWFSFSLSGLRQTIAMAICLMAYPFLLKDKALFAIPFALLVMVASLFHPAALAFLIIYPIRNFKIGWKHFLIFTGVIILFISFQSTVRNLLVTLLGDNRLEGYTVSERALTMSGFMIQCVIFAFVLYYYPKVKQRCKSANVLYNMSFVGLSFQLYASMIAELFRISLFFSIANIVLIPMAIASEKNYQVRTIEVLAVFAILLLYVFRSGIPQYLFFWQT